jgi:hypothetical protein
MKRNIKKILWVSFGLLSVVTIAFWYIFPILAYKFNYQHDALKMKYLAIKPTHADILYAPPQDWTDLQIGGIGMKIPLNRFYKIEGADTYVKFYSPQEILVIGDLAPSNELLDVARKEKMKYPLLSFRDRTAALESLPTDTGLFKSRKHNMEALTNQMMKFLSVTAGGISEIEIFNLKNVKAIIIISEKREKYGFSAHVEIYSQNERALFSMMLAKYKDKESLKNDLGKLLGGVRISDQPNDLAVAKKDINTFVRKHSGSQPANDRSIKPSGQRPHRNNG